MDTIPKVLTSVFIILLSVFIGISLLMCGTSVVSARSFYTSVADNISAVTEDDEQVMIEECQRLAEDNDYKLSTRKIVTEDGNHYYEVVLKYDIAAPFFGVIEDAKVSGYVYPGTHVRETLV